MTLKPYPPVNPLIQEQPTERTRERSNACRWPRLVLLVEDEPFVREATRGILESAGFHVLSVADAAAALKVYEASTLPIDLVMTDMVLPGRTGQQLGEDLRHRSPNLKVLVTSGYIDVEYAAGDPHSQTYFLAKPYSRRGLIAKIEEIFKGLPLDSLSLHQAAGKVG